MISAIGRFAAWSGWFVFVGGVLLLGALVGRLMGEVSLLPANPADKAWDTAMVTMLLTAPLWLKWLFWNLRRP